MRTDERSASSRAGFGGPARLPAAGGAQERLFGTPMVRSCVQSALLGSSGVGRRRFGTTWRLGTAESKLLRFLSCHCAVLCSVCVHHIERKGKQAATHGKPKAKRGTYIYQPEVKRNTEPQPQYLRRGLLSTV
jgi:hypothetical protein